MSTTKNPPTTPGTGSTDTPPGRRGGPFASLAPAVFWPAMLIVLGAAGTAILFPAGTEKVLGTLQSDVIAGFGWYYVLLVAGFVGFALWMGFSRFGDITLGKDDEEPEFSLAAWFSMLFAAGMGIGLVFWGAAEPLTFFTDPKPGVEGESGDLAQAAMAQTFLHWGFHAWAIYVIVGLGLAYAIHRKGRPISIRWALEPLLGEERVRGRLGDAIDVIAIVGTVAGVATSLGLGVQQISAGLVSLGLFEEASDPLMIGLVVGITAMAIVSVVSGVAKGIKWLSNANLVLAAVFLVALLLLGPTLFVLREFVQSIGFYLRDVLQLTFNTSAYSGDSGQAWQAAWTTFYWGWWMSWAPFVGVFIARISRGRTIREFVAGVLLVPTLVTFLWFAVLGGSAIYRQMNDGDLLESDGSVVSENVLFDLLQGMPAAGLLSGVAIVLITIFFVTSSDSGSLVVDMLASGGDPNPPTWSRVMWAILEGALAIGLLLAGGLTALQTGAILTALPFSLVMVGIAVATYKALKSEHRLLLRAENRQRREELAAQVGVELRENFDDHFGAPVERTVVDVLERENGSGNGSRGKGFGRPKR